MEAQYSLGECYHSGEGLEQNDKSAFEWFEKAAEQGHIEAQYAVGKYYTSMEMTRQHLNGIKKLQNKNIQKHNML